jgi:hypothetical protein
MYGGAYYPEPGNADGPRIPAAEARWAMRDRGHVPTIDLEQGEQPVALAATMLGTIAQSFQASLGMLVEQANQQTANTAAVVAQTVANAITTANAESRERDLRLMLSLQRESIEEAHKKAFAAEKEKRERTEDAEDSLCHLSLYI